MSSNIDFATLPDYVYSAEEQRVGTWLDGRPIYRKAWYRVDKNSQTIFPIPGLKDILKVDMTLLGINGDVHPVPVTNQGVTLRWIGSVVTERISYIENGDIGQYITCIVEYTKDID